MLTTNYLLTLIIIPLLYAKNLSHATNDLAGNPSDLAARVKTDNVQAQQSNNQNVASNRIVFIGASYVAEWNIHAIGKMTVINKGIGGEKSFDILNRFNKDVIALHPHAVVIWCIINDIFNANPQEIDSALKRTRECYLEMVRLAQDNQIRPILTTEVTIRGRSTWSEMIVSWIGKILGKASYQDYVNHHVIAMNEWIRQYAHAHNIHLLDFQPLLANEQGIRKKEYAVADGSHISPQGYEQLTSYTQKMVGFFLSTAP